MAPVDGIAVYADIFFLVNFSMDFASLLAAGQILAGKISLWRVAAAAAVGGVYAVGSLLIPGNAIFSLAIDFAVGLLLCFIAFGFRSPGRFFAGGALFFGVSLLTGGAVTALYGFLSSRRLLSAGGAGVLLPTAFLTAGGALLLSKIFRAQTAKRSARLTLRFAGVAVTVEGLVDSGHLAKEPLSGLPAVILSGYAMDALLPQTVARALRRLGESDVDRGVHGSNGTSSDVGQDEREKAILPENLLPFFRLLPVQTLGGRDVLPALLGEAEGGRVCIAFDVGNSERGAYGGFDCLIPGCLASRNQGEIISPKAKL